MKLWKPGLLAVLSICTVSCSPLSSSRKSSTLRESWHIPSPDLESELNPATISYPMAEVPQQQHWAMLQFIEDHLKRQKRSLDHVSQSRTKRGYKKGKVHANRRGKAARRRRRKNKGCVLKEIHLNITDLELGYDTQEELMFKYCSGSCEASESTYDIILKNLTKNKKLGQDNVQPQMCCRPTAFEDNLSFLDSAMAYQTLQRYSAKRCGCV